jgi:hypothetical protein
MVVGEAGGVGIIIDAAFREARQLYSMLSAIR